MEGMALREPKDQGELDLPPDSQALRSDVLRSVCSCGPLLTCLHPALPTKVRLTFMFYTRSDLDLWLPIGPAQQEAPT